MGKVGYCRHLSLVSLAIYHRFTFFCNQNILHKKRYKNYFDAILLEIFFGMLLNTYENISLSYLKFYYAKIHEKKSMVPH